MTPQTEPLSAPARALLCMQRHSWEQGTAMQAFYELGRTEEVVALSFEAAYRAMPDGRVATIGVTDGVTDPCAAGEALAWAAKTTGDEALCRGAAKLRVWALQTAPRNAAGVVYHLTGGRQFWADSLYMLPPYLAAIGQVDAALTNLYGYWDALYDPAAGLICHIWDEDEHRLTDAAHWGTGNGWALAGLARVIALLPKEPRYAADKARLCQMAQSLLERVLACRRADGAFGNVLDDDASFRELNLCQMTAYAIYRGVADGWLPDTALPTAEALRQTARQGTDAYGFVRSVCGAPNFDRPGVSPEAQAFALLMEAARARCLPNG